MSYLLNCSAHLKSTAKTQSWMQRLLWSLKSGLPSSVMQCGKWDLQLLVAVPWRARSAVVKSIFPIQCHLRKRKRLWHHISVCFLQQLSSQHEVALAFFCFLATLAYWALKLISHPFPCQHLSLLCALIWATTAPLLLHRYLQHDNMKTVFHSLDFVQN